MKCRDCGSVHNMGSAPVSMRSLLCTPKNVGLLTDDELANLDREWETYRRKNDLDCNGAPKAKTDGIGKKGERCS